MPPSVGMALKSLMIALRHVVAQKRRPKHGTDITTVPPPTVAGLATLSAKERLDYFHQRQQHRLQICNLIAIMISILLTAGNFWYTERTLDATRDGQITDRYAKALDQLGADSSKEVRIGAIYALERVAWDSNGYYNIIMALLAAFVREHDPAPDAKPPTEPDTDVQTALTVLLGHDHPEQLDLHGIRVPGAILKGDLRNTKLTSSDLTGTELIEANLTCVNMHKGDPSCANLTAADLTRATLTLANMTYATLARANLTDADLTDADLTDADLTDADLSGANLTRANLTGTNLAGANLVGVRGTTPDEILRVARTDARTRF